LPWPCGGWWFSPKPDRRGFRVAHTLSRQGRHFAGNWPAQKHAALTQHRTLPTDNGSEDRQCRHTTMDGRLERDGTLNGVTRTPATSSQTPTTGTQHLIRRGETLSGIAQRYGTTVDALLQANRQIRNPNLIYAGQTLTIPTTRNTSAPNQAGSQAGSQYVVRRGDTLSEIAARNGIDLARLIKPIRRFRIPTSSIPTGHQPAGPPGGNSGSGAP
jgi:LysM repeat protein